MSDRKPRLVIDTNVFVASFFGKTSKKVIDLWRNEQATLILSKAILNEYYEILSRFKFRRELKGILALFENRFNMETIQVNAKQRVVPDDTEDDKFIHCAEAGRADAIITSDEHLLRLKNFYDEIPIITPVEFIEMQTARRRQRKAAPP